ncbi:hypothetical protein HAX54_002886 [Datura stramonium]|uniref:Uncharacterized protein n=1 Tax=Datura stramonium TaxID=4076 RepID=A0ABS8RWK2_DATST|nr:hypothetical protein [Datura stramonium]
MNSEVHINICRKILVRNGLVSAISKQGDNTLAEDKVVLVAHLIFGFPLIMGALVAEEMHCRAVKSSTSLPFLCLLTQLCREAHVLVLGGINLETYATKKYDLEKPWDESRYDLKLHKLEVFVSSGQTAKATNKTTNPTGEATRTELVYHATPIPSSTPSTTGLDAMQQGVESTEMSSSMPKYSLYAFTPTNFARVINRADRQEKQLKYFA